MLIQLVLAVLVTAALQTAARPAASFDYDAPRAAFTLGQQQVVVR